MHIITAGCSFVFGDGLSDSETLPAQIQGWFSEAQVLNLSRQGGSVADWIYFTTVDNKVKDLEEQGFFLAFVPIFLHVPRLIGAMGLIPDYLKNSAYVSHDVEKDAFVYRGTFKENFPKYVFLSEVLMKSNFVRLSGLHWPLGLRREHVERYTQALVSLKKRYQEIHPKGRFIVVIYPLIKNSELFNGELERYGIEYLEYSQLPLRSAISK